MGKSYERNEFGLKPRVKIRIRGIEVKRDFRSRGEAIEWLEHQGYNRDEIGKTIKIIQG